MYGQGSIMRGWRGGNSTSLAKRFYIDIFVSRDRWQSVSKRSVCNGLEDMIDVYHILVSSGMLEGCRKAMADSGGP
jgi:hypothetical protein